MIYTLLLGAYLTVIGRLQSIPCFEHQKREDEFRLLSCLVIGHPLQLTKCPELSISLVTRYTSYSSLRASSFLRFLKPVKHPIADNATSPAYIPTSVVSPVLGKRVLLVPAIAASFCACVSVMSTGTLTVSSVPSA